MNHITDVKTVKEFLDKYYRPDRYTGRGEEYAAALLESHEKHFAEFGYDIISRHDNITGQPIFMGNRPGWMQPDEPEQTMGYTCSKCGTPISAADADDNDGRCGPCSWDGFDYGGGIDDPRY